MEGSSILFRSFAGLGLTASGSMSKRLRDIEVLPDTAATAMLGLCQSPIADEESPDDLMAEPAV